MILVFGSLNVDLVARVAAIPRPGETVLAPGYATLFGGKGANQAVAAARVSQPGQVAMVGRVGDDAFGRMCLDNLAENGVAVAALTTGPEPTGCAFITVDAAAENAITVASGANAGLTAAALPVTIVGPKVTLVLQMEVPFAASLDAAQRVRAAGGRVVWNLAPVPKELTSDDLSALLAATDILVVNEHEARAAAQLLHLPDSGLDDAAHNLAASGSLTCVVTVGARGAFAIGPNGARHDSPVAPIRPVDTTGAGDTFVGILAAGLDEGNVLLDVLKRACHGASLACLAEGAQAGMPTADLLL